MPRIVALKSDVQPSNASPKLVTLSGGTIEAKLFVLAEGNAAERKDVKYLATIPVFAHD